MRIVITGGTGLIGSRLAASLGASNHSVTVLTRSPEKHRGSMPEGVELHRWDGKTAEGWTELVDGADAVVNFAGENLAGYRFLPDRWSADKKQRIRKSRAEAAQAVLTAIDQASQKPGLLLQSSAIGYYGPRADEFVTEATSPGNDFLASVAMEWEETTQAAEAMGVRRVIVRTGLVMTPEGGPLRRLLLPGPLIAGPFGLGNQYWSWIHIADAVSAMHFLIEHETASGVFNLTGPEPVTNRELSWILARVARSLPVPVPSLALKILVGEVATVVLDGQRVIPERLESLGFTFRFADVESTFRDLLGK